MLVYNQMRACCNDELRDITVRSGRKEIKIESPRESKQT